MAAFVAPATAAPPAGLYPDTSGYERVSNFILQATNRDGVWFSTPHGIRCAIFDDGSVGCNGQAPEAGLLPGVPAGENEVAWFVGDPFPRLYHNPAPRFSTREGQHLVIVENYVEYRGSKCAVTMEGTVYCIHLDDPNSQFMVTTANVWRGADAVPAT